MQSRHAPLEPHTNQDGVCHLNICNFELHIDISITCFIGLKETAVKNFYIHFLLYFKKALLMVVVFQILKLHDVWLWSYSTAKYGKFK